MQVVISRRSAGGSIYAGPGGIIHLHTGGEMQVGVSMVFKTIISKFHCI